MTLSSLSLEGHAAIITGAGKGLGKGFAHALAESGANLLLVGRSENNIAATAKEIREKYGVQCSHFKADINDEEQEKAAAKACFDLYGKIDILVNNAAAMRNNIPPQETTTEAFEAVMHPNVTGTLNFCKAVYPYMSQRKYGRIVNIASMSALIVNKGVHGGSYEISKAAVVMLTKTLATEWGKEGINVNSICPGYYLTDPNKEFFAKDPVFYDVVLDMIPMGRLGELEELWGPLVLLCSPAASYLQGVAIPVDGGYTLW